MSFELVMSVRHRLYPWAALVAEIFERQLGHEVVNDYRCKEIRSMVPTRADKRPVRQVAELLCHCEKRNGLKLELQLFQ